MDKFYKTFYVIKCGDDYKIILESIYDKNDIFQEITKLFNKYSAEILKIVVNNSFKNDFETEFHLLIKSDNLEEVLRFIKGLGYNELG